VDLTIPAGAGERHRPERRCADSGRCGSRHNLARNGSRHRGAVRFYRRIANESLNPGRTPGSGQCKGQALPGRLFLTPHNYGGQKIIRKRAMRLSGPLLTRDDERTVFARLMFERQAPTCPFGPLPDS